jgi:hypothetical protein
VEQLGAGSRGMKCAHLYKWPMEVKAAGKDCNWLPVRAKFTVRRSLLFGLVGVAILTLPQVALAHGSIVRNHAYLVEEHANGPTLRGAYRYETTQVHPRVCMRLTLQRRPGGGGTWANLVRKRFCVRETSGTGWYTHRRSRKCNMDYRVVGTGVSYSPERGAHLKRSDTKILQNTC